MSRKLTVLVAIVIAFGLLLQGAVVIILFSVTMESTPTENKPTENQSATTKKLAQHKISVPRHGSLILKVPASWRKEVFASWREEVYRPSGELPPTVVFRPSTGDEFEVLITPLWSPKGDPTFNRSSEVKRLIEQDAKGMQPRAVEKELIIKAIKGLTGTGYYFLATDKAPPKSGEYPYAVRAGIGVDDLLLNVTVLCRSKTSESIAATIKMLQGAKKASTTRNGKKIEYRGTDAYDTKTGINIIGNIKNDIIALTNSKFHYGLILPYSDDWVFWSEGDLFLLRGNSGPRNVSLKKLIFPKTPKNYLLSLKNDLGKPGITPGLEDARLVDFQGTPVLRTQINFEEFYRHIQGIQINFFVAKKWEKELFLFHYSEVVEEKNESEFDENIILKQVTRGFNVDFMR